MIAVERIRKMAIPLCEQMQLRLVDIQVQGSTSKPIFNIFADSENGITLGQCTDLARQIQDELDMDAAIQQNYRLNVSSPGLDRPLSLDWEFQKNIGKNLKIQVREDETSREYLGELISWDKETIKIEFNGDTKLIPRKQIIKAKIKLQW